MRQSHHILVPIILVALCLIRFIHLGADTPDAISPDPAIYVDEGYKTLSPRNLILFGQTHWHSEDDYPGWMHNSPLTQWPYYAAFKLFGVNIQNARAVTVAWFFLFLLAYTYALSKYYTPRLFYVGLLALGLESTLFFFSRIALLEIPMITCVYTLLFILKRNDHMNPAFKLTLVLIFSLIATLLIKATAIIYMAPILFATIVVSGYITKGFRKQFATWWSLVLLLLVLLFLYQWVGDIALSRIDLSPTDVLKRMFFYPSIGSSPSIVVLGLLCAFYMLCLNKASIYHNDGYILSLLLMVVLGPIALALFKDNASRYYVPLLPAYILMCLEWVHLVRAGKLTYSEQPHSYLAAAIGIAILAQTIFILADTANSQILSHLNFLGQDPGISSGSMYKWITPLACMLAGTIYIYRKWLSWKTNKGIALICLILCVVYNGYHLGSFFLKPSYRSSDITKQIIDIIPADATILGMYAPFFMVNTKVKVLYLSEVFNSPPRIKLLRPDYLMDKVPATRQLINEIKQMEGVKLGPAIYKSEYADRQIILYPVQIFSD